MKWTVSGRLRVQGGREASVTWEDGKLTGDEYAVDDLRDVAAAHADQTVVLQAVTGWVSEPGDHAANSIGAYVLLWEWVFRPGTMRHSGDSIVKEGLDATVVN